MVKSPLAYMGSGPATDQNDGVVELATVAETVAGTNATKAVTPLGLASVAIAGAPSASTVQAGIIEIATNAEAAAQTDNDKAIVPSNLPSIFGATGAIGGTTPAAGTFTDLTADSTGSISLDADAASHFAVSGAGIDLTLESSGGRVVINGEEAAADAVRVLSAAGGLDVDVALLMSLVSSRNNAQAILINASAGGIDITNTGTAGEDIDIASTGASVNISATEASADAITIAASAGGIDITATGGDMDITASGAGLTITSTENAADSIAIISTVGGIDITCSAASAGEDIDITTSSSINLTATENAANAIYLRANGGTSETVKIHADQGTGVASIEVVSDVGGVTITGGVASADAINIVASNAGGGIDIDAGTAGFIVDTTGGISLDSAAASNFTATGAFDITVQSTAGSILINAGEAAADAVNVDSTGGFDLDAALQINIDSSQAAAANSVRIVASAADGGMDIDAGTGGITIDSTGAVSIDGAAASNFSVSGAGIDLTFASTGGRVVVNGEEAAADAVRILSAAGGLDTDVALQMSLVSSQNAADAIVINASAGGIDITAAGAAAEDLDLVCTAGSVNITAGESAADSMVLTSNGLDIVVAGAAGRDIDVTNTGGSVNITATESIASAIVINASGAAGGVSIDAGTSGLTIGTGVTNAVTTVATAASPYTVLGTDYFITTDSTGGIMTITLPATPATGRTIIVYDGVGQAAGNNVTVDGNGANIAAGGTSAATKAINTAYESYILTFNGTLWCGQNIV